jgi:pyridinium-3,5-bisthiocarboxylic acid mononucleotide nickel chelatase
MKTLYLDVFSGISGDMFLGAVLDLGLDFHRLEEELRKLPIGGYHLHVSRQERGAIAGTKFDVHLEEEHHEHGEHSHQHSHEHGHDHEQGAGHHHEPLHMHEHEHEHAHEHHGRTFAEIKGLIEGSSLSAWVRQKAVAVFERVAVAEGKIHGQPPERVHFHEVGAVDSIVDIVGACLALEMLGCPRVLAGPVLEGTGTVTCAHGRFPLPAPATLEILSARGVVVGQCDEPNELITPTGAALLAEFAEAFGPLGGLAARQIGYGLGTRQNKTRPNVLRVILGETAAEAFHDWETDSITVLETNLDDMNAEILGAFLGRALAAGALDLFHSPIQMKKNRPGVLLTLLCATDDADRLTALILTETTAFGVRRHLCERRKLRRESLTVTTPHGAVTVKVGRLDGKVVQVSPEYESCRALAEEAHLPLKEIYAAAIKATNL